MAKAADLSADPDSLGPWFDEAHDWIGTLEPPPTAHRNAGRTKASANKQSPTRKP